MLTYAGSLPLPETTTDLLELSSVLPKNTYLEDIEKNIFQVGAEKATHSTKNS